MKCNKCGNKVNSNQKFCTKCGNQISDVGMSNDSSKHWIQNTKLGIFFSKHEMARKILAGTTVILILLLIVTILSSLSDLDIQKGVYEYTGDESARIAILEDRIKIYGSIILIPLIFHYSSKLAEKR